MKKISLLVIGGCLAALGTARGGDFVSPGDGTVYDRSTKLLWQQSENARMSWQAAVDRCEGLTLAGRDDWRLPTKEELTGLVDRKRTDPSIDIQYFPKTKSTAYWTSTREEDRIFGIGFGDGEEFVFGGTELALYVRCVAEAKGSPAAVAAASPAKVPPPAPVPSPARPVRPLQPVKAAKTQAPPPAPTAAPPASSPLPDPGETMKRWADAWAKQDVATYLSFYGRKFTPPGNQGRSHWEQQRHRALTRPKWIKVELGDMEVDRSGDQVRLEFVQTYRSDVFQDKIRKAVVMVREGDRWAILSEETLPSSRN